MYCVLCTVYCVLCTVYCVLCTVYCVLCTVYCVLCTVYCVLCTVYCVLCTVYCVLCTVYCVLCTVYCVLCTVYCVLCTVYCVLCTVYCVLCTVYCVLCTVYLMIRLWSGRGFPGLRAAKFPSLVHREPHHHPATKPKKNPPKCYFLRFSAIFCYFGVVSHTIFFFFFFGFFPQKCPFCQHGQNRQKATFSLFFFVFYNILSCPYHVFSGHTVFLTHCSGVFSDRRWPGVFHVVKFCKSL